MTESTNGIVVGGCRLGEIIGRGGMGTVYRAVQLGVNRPVAVKLMSVNAADHDAIGRFHREAELAGALEHPHCLPLYAAGESDGLLYLVMRLVNGGDLAQLVARGGTLPAARAGLIIEQISGATDAAHRAGLVHRDLKPANILIEWRQGSDYAYVSDFGLMRGVVDDRQITMAGQWLGTPEFAAPEQMRGEPVGPAADIYALGAILRFMLGDGAPAAARAVIARAMARDPAARYSTAAEFGAAASSALKGRPPAAVARRPRRSPAALLAPLFAVLVAAAVVLIVTRPWQRRGHLVGSPTLTRAYSRKVVPSGNEFITGAFTAMLPTGWQVDAREQQKQGYQQTVLQSADGTVLVNIDRTAGFTGSMRAHLAQVQIAIAKTTPGYAPISVVAAELDGSPAYIWRFTVPGQATAQRVDIYRETGGSLYAVLGASNSMSDSYAAATEVAASIKAR